MKCKNSLSPSWSLCVLLSFILIAISYHMHDSIFLTRKCSLWRKFKSHKISLFFLTLYMLLECYVCAVWILKHKYALHYKAFWLNAQDFPFSCSYSLCDIILRKFQLCLWCMSWKKFHLITSNCNFLYENCVFFGIAATVGMLINFSRFFPSFWCSYWEICWKSNKNLGWEFSIIFCI